MIDSGLCRSDINRRVGRIVRAIKWAVSEEIVPPAFTMRSRRSPASAEVGPTSGSRNRSGPYRRRSLTPSGPTCPGKSGRWWSCNTSRECGPGMSASCGPETWTLRDGCGFTRRGRTRRSITVESGGSTSARKPKGLRWMAPDRPVGLPLLIPRGDGGKTGRTAEATEDPRPALATESGQAPALNGGERRPHGGGDGNGHLVRRAPPAG